MNVIAIVNLLVKLLPSLTDTLAPVVGDLLIALGNYIKSNPTQLKDVIEHFAPKG